MNAQHSQPTLPENGAGLTTGRQQVSRRTMLKLGALGLAASTLGILEAEAWLPTRIAHARPSSLPNIQFDINDYIAPARNINGTLFRFGPVHTLFITAQLKRTPTRADRHVLSEALETIEATYPFSPSGVFPLISYGLPYFNLSPAFRHLFKFTSSRLMFLQIVMPRKIAAINALPYAGSINPHSPMWMGFADQQVAGSGPAAITTFQGNASARFTSA